jgi:DNA-binding transcriptional MerR regulator
MGREPRFRIGELSRRVGVSPELLRAWERRYGVLTPQRTSGGLRLYSEDDARDVQEMTGLIAAGLSAAEAARVVLGGAPLHVPAQQLVDQLDVFLTALDEPSAQAALDQAFASYELEITLTQVVLPFLRNLGERWATGQRTVAQEHFASNVIGAKLRTLTRGWGDGTGPRALLACPEGEQHEIGLISFGLLVRERGWRIAYFGAQNAGGRSHHRRVRTLTTSSWCSAQPTPNDSATPPTTSAPSGSSRPWRSAGRARPNRSLDPWAPCSSQPT